MSTDIRQKAAEFTFRKEARFKNGKLAVYPLPRGDGGGKYEVAGVCERYHPKEAALLKSLVESEKYFQATSVAIEHYAAYTDVVGKWPVSDPVEFWLRDACYNRGPGGAAMMLQKALGVTPDGQIGPVTARAAMKQTNTLALLDALHKAQDWYERRYAKRDESSKFWKGLSARWKERLAAAKALMVL